MRTNGVSTSKKAVMEEKEVFDENDNYKGTGKIPQSSAGVKELCENLPEELSKKSGRENGGRGDR
ncbi:MAG: hypothetical protein R6U13_11595 [Desulfatiglandaceae bacterium]